jgi:hypothetical protein
MKKVQEIEQPLNSNERFLYAIAVRLEAIIEQNNSIIDALSKQNDIPVTEHKDEQIKEEKPKQKTKRKSTKKNAPKE